MALVKCSSCGKEISPRAKSCPHCGQPKPAKKKPSAKKALIGLGLVILAVIVLSNLGGKSEKPANTGPESKPAASEQAAKPTHDIETACYMARSFVRKQLKAPKSAEFPHCRDIETWPVPDREGVYRSQGYVDSKNALGVMVRANYVCTIKFIGGDKWALEDIKLTEQ